MVKLRRFKGSPYLFAVGRDSNGKRWAASTKQTDRAAAARVAQRLAVERAVPGVRPFTLSQALIALAEHKRRKRVSDSELGIVATKGANLLNHWGASRNLQPHAFARTDVDQYVDARRAAGIADSTIRKELGKLWEALRIARRAKLWTGELDDLKTDVLAPEEPGDRWLDDPEYDALMREVVPTRRDHLLVHCHTGVRYGELYRIEARHLDRAGRRVYVLGTKGKRAYRERWVPLSPDAFDVLAARAKARPTGPLFPDRWLVSTMKKTLARACRRAGIAPVTANDLRRTFATWCCRRGVTERECQRFMGHSPASMLVRRVYAQQAPEAGAAAVAAFPRVSQQVSQTAAALADDSGDGRTTEGAVSA